MKLGRDERTAGRLCSLRSVVRRDGLPSARAAHALHSLGQSYLHGGHSIRNRRGKTAIPFTLIDTGTVTRTGPAEF